MAVNRLLSKLVLMLALFTLIPAFSNAQSHDKGPELDKTKDYYALMKTSMGDIKLKLLPDVAPITVRSFVNLSEGTAEFTDPKTRQKVKRPFYEGLIFHRVGPNFMIQGGDPLGTGTGNPGFMIPLEVKPGVNYDKGGKLAMARSSNPNSAGSQFFITEGPYPGLNQNYAIFGEVVEGTDGIDVVKKIARVELSRRGPDGTGKPAKDVVIEKVKIVRVEKGASTEEALKALDAADMEKAEEAPKAEAEKDETKAPRVEKTEETSYN